MMNATEIDNIDFLKALASQSDKEVYSYYKYAFCLVSEDLSRLEQMIKCIYYPMSLYFGKSISYIERAMRETISRLYVKTPALFERITKYDPDMSPTVSEVLGMLIDLEYSDNH